MFMSRISLEKKDNEEKKNLQNQSARARNNDNEKSQGRFLGFPNTFHSPNCCKPEASDPTSFREKLSKQMPCTGAGAGAGSGAGPAGSNGGRSPGSKRLCICRIVTTYPPSAVFSDQAVQTPDRSVPRGITGQMTVSYKIQSVDVKIKF